MGDRGHCGPEQPIIQTKYLATRLFVCLFARSPAPPYLLRSRTQLRSLIRSLTHFAHSLAHAHSTLVFWVRFVVFGKFDFGSQWLTVLFPFLQTGLVGTRHYACFAPQKVYAASDLRNGISMQSPINVIYFNT